MLDLNNYYKIQVAEGTIDKTIDIDSKEEIKAFYCGDKQRIHTYLFDKEIWTYDKAQEWVDEFKEVEPMDKIKKVITCEFKKFDDEKLSFDAIASTNEVDRDGDTLQVSGWKLKNFRKNPVMLWGHNSGMLPIGRAENIRKDNENGKLLFTPIFTPKEINPLGEQVYRMFKAKFLNAFSVRFNPIEWEDRKLEEGEEPKRDMWGNVGRNYKEQELLEVSPVTVPSNAGALANRGYQDMILKGMLAEYSDIIKDPNEREKFLKGITISDKEFPGEEREIKDDNPDRAISEKSCEIIKMTIEQIGKADASLKQILEISESKSDETDDEIKKLKEELEKENKDIGIEELIQRGKDLLDNGGK